ncbi:MAG: hypothetical protein H6717_37550 [Polyangiaceae bacterium]|nr:hypothetical protein [Polyangiaceae bacterium]
MKTMRVATVVVSVLCAVATSACGGEEFNAAPSTGGAGGTAGSGGTDGGSTDGGGTGGDSGGASGSGGTIGADCTKPADCDDGKACNGTETCANGKCQAGAPVDCANPDPNTCTAECQEPTGTCVVAAKDEDSDNHTAACPADPGDDCDDSDANTYPGAPEICDGKDNNCNGLDDLQEGKPLGGTAKKLVGIVGKLHRDPHIAWCPGGKKYVLVWTDNRDGYDAIWGASLSQAGALGVQGKISSATAGDSHDPRVACSGSECAVVWRQTSSSYDVYVQRVDCDGKPQGTAVNVSETAGAANGRASVASFNGDWYVGFLEKDATGLPAAFRVLAPNGTPKTSTQFVSTGNGLRNDAEVAATATHVAQLWELNGVIEWVHVDSSFGASASEPLSSAAGAKSPVVGAIPTGFGFAWHLPGALEYKERGSDGGAGCSIAKLGTFTNPWPIGVVNHASGPLVAVLDATSGTNVSAALVRTKDCKLIDQPQAATFMVDTIDQHTGAFAAGESGYAMVWGEGPTGNKEIHGRVFGPNLCD